MSSASRGRRPKRPPKSPRQGTRRPVPLFRGLDRATDQDAVDDRDVEAYLSGVAPSVLVDAGAVQELVARRRFAVSTLWTSIDGDDLRVDPADEDERELLIIDEHPQYQHVLDDAMSDELVDGVNPRLHIALHQVVANQLWEDTPPEVWQAAQRLLAAGHDRHAILHALAYELAEELHPALTGEHPPDPEMNAYRNRLRQL